MVYHDATTHSLARFIFKYRYKDVLKQLLLMPRPDDRDDPSGQPPQPIKREPKQERRAQHFGREEMIDVTAGDGVDLMRSSES